MKKRDKVIKKLQDKVIAHFVTGFALLAKDDFVGGDMRYNYKCFYNAVHEAKTKSISVHLVFCHDKKDAELQLHVINKYGSKFQDNTLGYRYTELDYYYIREVLPCEYGDIWNVFEEYRKSLIRLLGGEKKMIKYKLASNEIF